MTSKLQREKASEYVGWVGESKAGEEAVNLLF